MARAHCSILWSQATWQELQEVILRPKFERYGNLEFRECVLQGIAVELERVEVSTHLSVCRDPRDDKFLELAIDGRAEYVVTGDDDLLSLRPFRGIEILSPSDFLARFPS